MTIKNLINATMSTYDNDFMETVNLSEIEVFRKNPSGKAPIKIIGLSFFSGSKLS